MYNVILMHYLIYLNYIDKIEASKQATKIFKG